MKVTALLGEDRGRARHALGDLFAASGLDQRSPDVSRIDGGRGWADEAAQALAHAPWVAARRVVVVWDLPLAGDTDGLERLEEWARPDGEVTDDAPWLIIWAPAADRRLKAVKALEAAHLIVPVAPPDAWGAQRELTALVEARGGRIRPEAAGAVVALVGSGLDALVNEAEKLTLLAGEGEIGMAEVSLATTGRPDVSVFRLTEALSAKRLGDALRVAGQLLGGGESGIGLIAMLAREMRLLARTKALGEASPSKLGVPAFVASRLGRDARLWSGEEIRRAFPRLLKADLDLKTGAKDGVTMELCLIDLVGSADGRGRT